MEYFDLIGIVKLVAGACVCLLNMNEKWCFQIHGGCEYLNRHSIVVPLKLIVVFLWSSSD